MSRRLNPSSLPYTLILILVGALLVIALLPELRYAIGNATNITGAGGTLLGYVPFIIVAGLTLVIVYSFLGGGGRTRLLKLSYDLKSLTKNLTFRNVWSGKHRGITVAMAIPVVVALVIAFIIGISIMEQLAYEISVATGTNGSLEGTLEATLLNLWVTIIVAGILIGTLSIFMFQSVSGRRRNR